MLPDISAFVCIICKDHCIANFQILLYRQMNILFILYNRYRNCIILIAIQLDHKRITVLFKTEHICIQPQ